MFRTVAPQLSRRSLTAVPGRFNSTGRMGYESLFYPTETHEALRDTVRSFAEKELRPNAAKWDRDGGAPKELFKKFADLGLLGLTIPEEDGGTLIDATATCIVHEEMSREDPGATLAFLAHSLLFVNNLYNNANPEQRAKWIPPALTGDLVGCMGMTEPDHGTDVLGMGTTAVLKGDKYIINGAKTYITNAPMCDAAVFYAKVDGRITLFVIDRNTPGFTVSEKINKVGMRASTMAYLYFNDAEVPVGNVLGEVGGGLKCMMQNLEIERLALAAQSTGMAMRSLEIMTQWAKDRKAFGKSLAEHGQIQKYIGDSYTDMHAARCLVYNVARELGPGRNTRTLTDAAKNFAAQVGKRVTDNAIQTLGGAGYTDMFPVERLWRDAKLIEIGGGTLESHQKNITRDLMRAM